MKVSTALYNNWQQSSEFIIIHFRIRLEDNFLHIGAGFCGLGFETFIKLSEGNYEKEDRD